MGVGFGGLASHFGVGLGTDGWIVLAVGGGGSEWL